MKEQEYTEEPMMTPNHIDILIHYYTTPGDHPRIDAPAVEQTIEEFVSDGILWSSYGSVKLVNDKVTNHENKYYITEKGKVWLLMILKTPYPTLKKIWVDGNDNIIDAGSL